MGKGRQREGNGLVSGQWVEGVPYRCYDVGLGAVHDRRRGRAVGRVGG